MLTVDYDELALEPGDVGGHVRLDRVEGKVKNATRFALFQKFGFTGLAIQPFSAPRNLGNGIHLIVGIVQYARPPARCPGKHEGRAGVQVLLIGGGQSVWISII